MASVVICLAASDATLAYMVNYDGQVIATVNSKKLFSKAVSLAINEVEGNVENNIHTPDYRTVLTLKSKLNSANEVKKAILENTESVVFASVLTLNSEPVAYVDTLDLEDYLTEYRNSFNLKSGESVSEFVDDIDTATGYFTDVELLTLDQAEEIINRLSVKTTATVVTDTEIPYSTEYEKTSTQMLGYSKVKTSGKNGIKRTSDKVIYLNGDEVSRENISSKVITEPVTQVTVVGTSKSLASAKQRKEAYSSGFIFPLPKGCGWKISSYWGDGRGHKGMDLCTSYGTNIYAAAAGKVTYAGYKSDYGYMVIIDHGNGLSTAYAHCSTLGVSTGDSVAAGETIALVGSTGQSTGNHLHFEVRKNGTRIDPAPYIGLD